MPTGLPTGDICPYTSGRMVGTDARGNPIVSPEKLRIYLERRRTDLQAFRDFLSTCKYAEIREIAHRIKGSAGMYGFDDLGEICARLESSALAADDPEVRREVEAFGARLEIHSARLNTAIP